MNFIPTSVYIWKMCNRQYTRHTHRHHPYFSNCPILAAKPVLSHVYVYCRLVANQMLQRGSKR